MDSKRNPGIVRGRGYRPPISRRAFLRLEAMSTAALALGSCTPSPDGGSLAGITSATVRWSRIPAGSWISRKDFNTA